MKILTKLSIRNFKGIRIQLDIDLNDSLYLIGPNNAGKSAVLAALNCYFNDSLFKAEYLNRTDYRAKQEGYNRSDIALEYDLTTIHATKTRERMVKTYSDKIRIRKSYYVRDKTGDIVVRYFLGENEKEVEELDADLVKLMNSIKISYIHPQQAEVLLNTAQSKLKDRIITNFGRHSSVSQAFNQLKASWQEARKVTNESISRTLTQELQKIWPGCETKVDLPKEIEELIRVSDITFRSETSSPPIELTSQGTGAQSTILYQTHFILDSDRTLHQGLYYPVWLVEEPESFLHTDLAVKLGNLLNSDNWLKNIQFFITTHDGCILSTSSQNSDKINIAVVNNNKIQDFISQTQISDSVLEKIGDLLGDKNFSILYLSFTSKPVLYIEDSRDITVDVFKKFGFGFTKSLNGSGMIKRYLDVISNIGQQLTTKNYFLVDSDKGLGEIKQYLLEKNKIVLTKNQFSVYEVVKNVKIIVLPDGCAIEDMFLEFDTFLDGVIDIVFDDSYIHAKKGSIPSEYTRIHAELRSRTNENGIEGAKKLIKKNQDVKDQFWKEIETKGYSIAKKYFDDLTAIFLL